MNKQPATDTVVVPNSALAAALLKLPSAVVSVLFVLVILICLNLPDIPINLGVMTVSLPMLATTVVIPALLTVGRVIGVNMSQVYQIVTQLGYELPPEQPELPRPAMQAGYPAEPIPFTIETRLDSGLVAVIPSRADKARLTLI